MFQFLNYIHFGFCPDIFFPIIYFLIKFSFHGALKNSKADMKLYVLTSDPCDLFSLTIALFRFQPPAINRLRNSNNNQRSKTIKEKEFLHKKASKFYNIEV